MKSVHQKPAHLAFDGASNIAFKGMCFRILCTPSLWGLGIIMVDYLVAWRSRRFMMMMWRYVRVLNLSWWGRPCLNALRCVLSTIYVNVLIVPRASVFLSHLTPSFVVYHGSSDTIDHSHSTDVKRGRQCKMNVRGGRVVRPWASRSKLSSAMAMTVWVYVGSRLVYHPSVPITQCCACSYSLML